MVCNLLLGIMLKKCNGEYVFGITGTRVGIPASMKSVLTFNPAASPVSLSPRDLNRENKTEDYCHTALILIKCTVGIIA